MSSQRQIEANAKNAQLSTGPRSADGKARVASNALKHGLTGKQIVLPNEKPSDFDAFRLGLLNELSPKGELEGILAERTVVDAWRLRRVPVLEATLYRSADETDASLEKDPSLVAIRSFRSCSQSFVNLWRHADALSRSWFRTFHELQRLQAIRAGEQVAPPAVVDIDLHINQDGAANPGAISQNNLPSPEPIPAKVVPDATPLEDKKAQVSFFITKSQKAQLRERGFSEDDIAKMKPGEAHKILGLA
jgi:hypothetical protein